MSDLIHIERKNNVYQIEIRFPLSPKKAALIKDYISNDAGDAQVEIDDTSRLQLLTAKGIVSAATMRSILNVLAD